MRFRLTLLALPSLALGLGVGAACTGDIGTDPSLEETVPEGSCAVESEVQFCYPGDPANVGIGECHSGTTTCLGGFWSDCEGATLPAEGETCDDNLDDNCDGVADEGCGCTVGDARPCYTGPGQTRNLGLCMDGIQQCASGVWSSACEGEVLPGNEDCDGADNNCNGLVDDGCACVDGSTQPCYTGPNGTQGVGLCNGGQLVCTNGQWPSTCQGEITPKPETCNGSNDDCDAQTDEGNPGGGGACNTGLQGDCAAGTQQCSNGSLVCQQNQQPQSESCNGDDDDCDGQTDEGNPGGGASCSTGLMGICAAGTVTCTGGMLVCQQNQMAQTENCSNQLDDDCDGQTDEGCCNNIAPGAAPSSSGGGSGGYGPGNWNDGVTGSQCTACDPCFGWISNGTTPSGAWMQYDWTSPVTIGSMSFDSTDCGTSCGDGRNLWSGTIEYWNGSSWVTSTSFNGMIGDFSVTLPTPVTTTAIRVYDATTGTCGIQMNTIVYEWYVYPGQGC